MKEGYYKGFYCSNLAYYAKSLPDRNPETMITMASDGGGTDGEFAIRWHDIRHGSLTPQIHMFDDAWKLFKEMPELFDMLSELDDKNIGQDELSRRLKQIGFKDITSYVMD